MDAAVAGAAAPARVKLAFPAGAEAQAALGEPAEVRGELFLPAGLAAAPRALLVCLPGGAMNRGYFDLPTPEGEAEASFARAMTARGFAVALFDYVGVGESPPPADLFRLTLEAHAAANAAAVRELLARLHAGRLPGVPAWPGLRSIGVGHSYGAAQTIVQQARDPIHAGLALFGYGLNGTPQYLTEEERALTPEAARPVLGELARKRFGHPVIPIEAPGGARSAILAGAMDRLYAVVSYAAMIPNLLLAETSAVKVPVLLALGDKDMQQPTHAAPMAYPASPDVTLLVLPDTRHNHFIYPTRTRLFDRLAHWAGAL
jgi:pimeloyl-ACP methyl ester carboxylesterase